MRILGIDPGFSGAMALLMVSGACGNGELLCLDDMPVVEVRQGHKVRRQIDVPVLSRLVGDALPDLVVCEWIAAAPGMGASSAFRFGQQLGLVQGVCAAHGLRLHLVTPSSWKQAMRLSGGKEGKAAARARATGLWPERMLQFKRVKDDGRAEAALIARWAHLAGVAVTA